ncbi:hypothetical protein DH2020_033647 [Rehmannia glutinosa]|uniref:Ty3 transposon capsid-like protein domain-containing protein n=1 Tax=Rehmannia glutinosa TaxID=99300 RepID=A0ABR0VBQ7_REHGL
MDNSYTSYKPLPRIDFPRFDGNNPRSWILKCNGYFKLIPNIPDVQKVTLASMHFEGKAASWFQNYSQKFIGHTWNQFLEVVTTRFEELKESKIIVEFNKLKKSGSYNEYVERFEELRACMMLINNLEYSEEYFIASFVSGLSEEVQSFLTMFEPSTLQQAIDLGRKQIHTLEVIAKQLRNPSKPFFNPSAKRVENVISNPTKPMNTSTQRTPMKLLTASEMAARREKGLCYNCDDAFTFGHRCKHRINYMIMTEEEELSYLQPTETEVETPVESMEEIQMSINAITGEDGITTMRLNGEVGEHKLHILIDSGSTLSFIQEDTALKLGCYLEAAKPLLVKVANGQTMVSTQRARGFKWNMQGHTFTYSPRVLKNEGCDMILGWDWLKSCTPIELDYEKMTFTVTMKWRKVKLQALTSTAECKFISGPALYKLVHIEEANQIEELFVLTNAKKDYISPDWVQQVVNSYSQDLFFTKILTANSINPDAYKGFDVEGGLVRHKGRVGVGDDKHLKELILATMHS